MKLQQLSVFLENRPGSLIAPCRILAEAGINLMTLCLADAREFGILRVMVRDADRAKGLLEAGGMVVKATEVVALEVPDQPGGLADLLDVFDRSGINVEYMYAFTVKQENRGLLVFRFQDPDKAIEALRGADVNVIDEVELFRRCAAGDRVSGTGGD
jgi:hypothetical protein